MKATLECLKVLPLHPTEGSPVKPSGHVHLYPLDALWQRALGPHASGPHTPRLGAVEDKDQHQDTV